MQEIAVVQTTLPIDIERGAAIARQLRDYLRQARMTVRIQGPRLRHLCKRRSQLARQT
jgi:hypothetical protein